MADMDVVPPSSMNDATAHVISISTQIMIGTVVVLIFVVAFCFFLHMYVKCIWTPDNEDPNMVSWRRRLAGQRRAASVPAHRRGLDPAALRSLPVVVYNPKDFKDGLECAVCLSEVSEGEKARILPKCNHGFHVECIDMWFQSHSTCPLCRDPVVSTTTNSSYDSNNDLQVQDDDDDGSYLSDSNSDSDDGSYASPRAAEAPNFPTNVLFWGDETRVSAFGQAAAATATAASSSASESTSSSGVSRPRVGEMVIDIPSHEVCGECLSPPPRVEEAKTPAMTRLRSLRRLLSMGQGNKVASSNCDVNHQV